MKKLSKLLALVASLATFVFMGCSDLNETGSVANGVNDTTSNAKEYSISFAATDGTTLPLSSLGINSNSVSNRTIVADAIDLTGTGIYFYVWGKNEVSGATIDPTAVTFVKNVGSTTTGTVVLDFPASKYYFVLAATQTAVTGNQTSAYTEKAVYIGYANVDLRNSDEIKFYISSNGLTGTGGFSLTLKADISWKDDDKAKVTDSTAYTITAAPYDRSTGLILDESYKHDVTNADFFGSGDVFSLSGVAPGSYTFTVNFRDIAEGIDYEYSDILIILPNQTVTKTIEVPDVIESSPDAPTLLKVAYITPTNANLDEYNAVLEWEDMSKNEKYFEIKFYDVTSQNATKVSTDMQTAFEALATAEQAYVDALKANPVVETDVTAAKGAYEDARDAAETKWSTAINGVNANLVYTYGKEFYGNTDEGWVAGSLQRNNEHVVIRLTLGKRYLFSIAAVNDAGTSKYTYATYSTDIEWTDDDPFNAATDPYEGNAYSTKKAKAASVLGFTTSATFASTDVPDGVTTVYASSTDATNDANPITDLTGLSDATTYYYNSPAGYEDATSLTANLYRLVYHLYTGTYVSAAGTSTTDDIVEYLAQGDIDLKCPKNPIVTGSSAVYPQLYNLAGKRWTSWKQSGISGTDYGTKTTVSESGVNFTYYDPGDYTGYANLDLYASYSLTDASVVAYNDSDYDLVDIEAGTVQWTAVRVQTDTTAPGSDTYYASEDEEAEAISDWSGYSAGNTVYTKATITTATPIISIDAVNGVDKTTNKYYTVSSKLSAISFTYNGTLYGSGVSNGYSSLKAIVTRSGATVASGLFNASKKFSLTVNTLPLGVYTVTVIAEYQGNQYTYPILISVEDSQ